jgi:hypothetical protein
MSICPFCKAQTPSSHGPCAKCGKRAADHPSIAGTAGRTLSNDFEDDDGGDFILEAGGSVGSGAHTASSGYGGGVDLDSDFEDEPQGDLELDLPAGQKAIRSHAPAPQMTSKAPSKGGGVPDLDVPPPKPSSSGKAIPAKAPPSSGRAVAPPPAPSSGRMMPQEEEVSEPEPEAEPAPPPEPPKPNPAAAIAKYPPPPRAIWQAPVYACKVIWRQLELRQDLESLRRKRSPDVALYEAALKAYEKKSFNVGLAMTIAAMVLATFVFFLPVIIRFIRMPD